VFIIRSGYPVRPDSGEIHARMRTAMLLPVLDEAATLADVLRSIPRPLLRGGPVVVCDNGSTDGSAEIARSAGVMVVTAPRRGYGTAVKAGLAHLRADPPDCVVVLDADGSVVLEELADLLAPIAQDRADLVTGDRTRRAEPGALTGVQQFGNVLATELIAARTGLRTRDLGPFRAVRWSALQRLDLVDPTWGWNVEMNLKAARAGLRVVEVPVGYRRRQGGQSKISGSVRGAARAGFRILQAVWRYG
jgi:glycosyltransferase involved in cell wall biosynthesis